MITKESELHHSIGSLIDGAHPNPKTDRDYLYIYIYYVLLCDNYIQFVIYVTLQSSKL